MNAAFAAYRELRDSGCLRLRSRLSIVCRWERDADRCSRWTSQKRFISRSCDRELLGTSAIGALRGRCIKAVEAKHPSLAKLFRIEDVNEPVDLLRR